MQIRSLFLALVGAAALASLAACSVDNSSFPVSHEGSQSRSRIALDYAPSGVAPQFLERIRVIGQVRGVHPNTPGPRDLAVSDFATGGDEILDHNYALEQFISDPTGCPDGNFYDRNGRLYNADYCGSAVTEYDQSGSLIFTYAAAGMNYPVDVTTDRANDVYVDDYGPGRASVVVEFRQGNSTPVESCPTGLANEGIAVDTSGAVFVAGNDTSTGLGKLLEYSRGLAGCPTPTTLGVTLSFAGALQIDNAHNLVACDQNVGVDIIPPPYTSIAKTITGAQDAFHVALNKVNGKIFITDAGSQTVLVDLYPSGTPFLVLGSANGLTAPASATANPSSP
jgi:hypothetical protein